MSIILPKILFFIVKKKIMNFTILDLEYICMLSFAPKLLPWNKCAIT